jgi:lactate permease
VYTQHFDPVGEGDLFRVVFKWSVFLVLILCVIVVLRSTAVLSWMVP